MYRKISTDTNLYRRVPGVHRATINENETRAWKRANTFRSANGNLEWGSVWASLGLPWRPLGLLKPTLAPSKASLGLLIWVRRSPATLTRHVLDRDLGVWGLGSGVWGLGSGSWGLGPGSGVWGLGSEVWILGIKDWIRSQGSGVKGLALGSGLLGLGNRVWG